VSTALFSSSWYRVAGLKPKLRGHARVHRHRYRGRVWYVVEDVANQRFHRFTPAAHATIGMMDGEQTVDRIWRLATETLGDDAPTQDEMIRMLGQLHGADLLRCEMPPDTAELLKRHQQKEKREWRQRFMNPLAIRIPLFDPDRVLERGMPLLRPFFTWAGVLLWLAIVLPAVALAAIHWTELTEGVLDHLFAPQTLLFVWLIFPIVKVFHEFGHGFAAKAFGAEVHDMGVMFLVFTPIPYVDASSASAFADRNKRALVGAAGMIVEVLLAALALLFWVAAEPGPARNLAYNTILIAGITTVAFNANPLLRFDGYYILADWLEIPNLRARANSYVGYLTERYAFGREEAEPPDVEPREKAWLAGFSVAAFLYRIVVLAGILLLVLEKSLVLGAVLGAVGAVLWIGKPLFKGLRFVFADPRLRPVRGRAVGVVVGTAAAVLVVVGLLPMPLRKQTEGVVWIPDEAFVRATASGFVERVVAEPGSTVAPGDLLLACTDPDLVAEVRVLEAKVRGLRVRYAVERTRDVARAEMVGEQLEYVRRHLERARERLDELEVRSGAHGIFVVANAEDLPGRYVRKGELLAHVVSMDALTVRAVVSQHDIDLVQRRLEDVRVRLAEDFGSVHPARTVRVAPAALERLPHGALGSSGGGRAAVDPRDERGVTAVEKWFQVDLELLSAVEAVNVGGRVHVRFALGTEPLLRQWYRGIRQVFLSRFDV
jgi:putative peptide zinc metalloprotease protein